MILEAETALQVVAAATTLQFPPEQGARDIELQYISFRHSLSTFMALGQLIA